jgi:hypothetical protein
VLKSRFTKLDDKVHILSIPHSALFV